MRFGVNWENPTSEDEFRKAIGHCENMGWECEEEADRLKDESEEWYDRSRDLENRLEEFLDQDPAEQPVAVSEFQLSVFDVREKL